MISLADDQRTTIDFLSKGDSYGLHGVSVRRIETHWSEIFLVRDRAYKLKRQAAFSLLDYATVEKRERACRAELDVNAATAPDLYLGVRQISCLRDGTLGFDGDRKAVDWVVVMRRFDQEDLLDHLADARRLDASLMCRLADEIARFHARAEITAARGVSTIRTALERWCDEQRDVDGVFEDGQSNIYARDVTRVIAEQQQTLGRRRGLGKVRRCHGDLRLANICLLDGRPTLFDAIEFSDELSCIDVLYDLAFLLMDLHHRGLADLGNIVFNRYLDITNDTDGLRVLPLFLSCRAAIRAQMLAANAMRQTGPTGSHLSAMARSHLALATSLLQRRCPRVIAVGGLGSTAKSELAVRLAAYLGPAPGARLIHEPIVRRHLMGASPEARLGRTAYDSVATAKVYDALSQQVAATLAAGFAVVIDADFFDQKDRRGIFDLAAATGVPFTGLWFGEREHGLRTHHEGPADAGTATRAQTWHWIDTSHGPSFTLAAARAAADSGAGRA
jgi:aminoglycoside phosphotransferase family enzyme/predicted kinase